MQRREQREDLINGDDLAHEDVRADFQGTFKRRVIVHSQNLAKRLRLREYGEQ